MKATEQHFRIVMFVFNTLQTFNFLYFLQFTRTKHA